MSVRAVVTSAHADSSLHHFLSLWAAGGGRQHVSISIQTPLSQLKHLIIVALHCTSDGVCERLNVAFNKLYSPFSCKLTN